MLKPFASEKTKAFRSPDPVRSGYSSWRDDPEIDSHTIVIYNGETFLAETVSF